MRIEDVREEGRKEGRREEGKQKYNSNAEVVQSTSTSGIVTGRIVELGR